MFEMEGNPLFTKVDAVVFRVPNIDTGLAFYRDRLGHKLLWRSHTAAGLSLGESETELVMSTQLGPETDLKVESVDTAIHRIVAAGGGVVSPATDIPIGKVAVVRDPFGNELVILDSSKGLLTTDERGNVTGVSRESNKDATI